MKLTSLAIQNKFIYIVSNDWRLYDNIQQLGTVFTLIQ